MASISGGSVVWQLDIDDSKFKSKLKNASSSINSSVKQTSSETQGSWLKMGATMGAVAGAAGLAVSKAMQVIGNSVGDAVKRVDILNNFPKIMSNMNVSASESEKVINELSDSLQGLPTPLDTAALAVQRLTASTGNVSEAKDVFVALNNAVLAGGAPMELQAGALEQFSQAFAKGKPDMIEWRSLMSAMPAQLKQLAQEMGKNNIDELGTALREGEITMEEFSDALVKLNKEGTGNFQSFEEQARNSTEGIQTGMANMKTAIARGIADIFDSIGQANISGALKSVGDAFEEATSRIAGALRSTIEFFKENEVALAALKGVLAGVALFIGVALVKAFAGLALALGAALIPMLPFIAAGAALGLAALAVKKNWDKIKPVIDKVREAFEKFWEFIQPVREFIADQLTTALESVIDIGKQLVDSLKPLIETLKEILANEKVQKVLKIIGAVLAGIAAVPIVVFFATMVASLTILSKVLEFVARHFETIKKVVLTALAIALAPFYTFILIIIGVVKTFISVFGTVRDVFTSVTEWIGEKMTAIKDFIVNAIQAVWNFISPILNFIKNLFIIVFGGIALIVLLTFKKIYQTVSSILSAVWNFISPILSSIKNFFVSIWNSIFEFVKARLTAMYNFYKNIFTSIYNVIKGIVDSIINFFRPAATWLYDKGTAIIKGLVNGIKSVANTVWDAIKVAADKIGEFFSDAGSWLWDTGRAIISGLVDGIKSAAGWVSDSVSNIANDIKGGFTSALDIFSPSKVFRGYGENIGQGLVKGLDSSQDLVKRAVDGLSSATTDSFISRPASLPNIGAQVAQGSVSNQDVTIGTVVLNDQSAVQEFFKQLNQDNINLGSGLTPRQGVN